MKTFAAINVGSYEQSLKIYTITKNSGIREVDWIRNRLDLGGTFATGKLSHEVMDELCAVLRNFVSIMEGYRVDDYRACATSAIRETKNTAIVLDQIMQRTGVKLDVLSNSEQRFISYKAIAAKETEFQKIIQQGTAIVDVGFGSMQVSLFDKDALVTTQSLPLGVLRLKEFLANARVSAEVEHSLVKELVDNELMTFRKMYLKDREFKNVIAIGEPILTLYYKTEAGKRKEQLTAEEFDHFYTKIKSMTKDQLEDVFDVNGEYAQMLFPTASIYKRMLDITGAQMIWVPGIRMVDGMAAEYAEDKKLLKFNHDFSNDIIVAAKNIARRYKCQMSHIQAVEDSALKLFDTLKRYHGMKSRERLLLQIAVNLHACGKFVTMRDALDCAYNIIMSTEIIGLSHVEREIVANVVKYHDQKFRYNEVEVSAKPSRDSRLVNPENLTLMIAKLTAILRLANSMDRSHLNKLADCKLNVRENQLVISTDYSGDVTLEAISIAEKGDFFEEIFGVRPVLRQKKKV